MGFLGSTAFQKVEPEGKLSALTVVPIELFTAKDGFPSINDSLGQCHALATDVSKIRGSDSRTRTYDTRIKIWCVTATLYRNIERDLPSVVEQDGIGPPTRGFSVPCSTN